MSDRSPFRHHFQSDPKTPTACIVCGLGRDWHPEHQPKDSDRYLSLPMQAALRVIRESQP